MPDPVVVSMRPALYTDNTGQKWAIAGSTWVAVPEDATLSSIDNFIVYEPFKPTKPSLVSQSWVVKGSKGNDYTVSVTDGIWSCTCAGFGFRRKCRHITEVKDASR